MASFTLTIYDIPEKIKRKYINMSYHSKVGKPDCTIILENFTLKCTLQSLNYSKAIYRPGELIFKLQISGSNKVNDIYSTFKGKRIGLVSQEDSKTNSIAKDYYIFGIQIEKKTDAFYAMFRAYDPFKYLTLDTYCKAYTGKKFIQNIFLNRELWPNNLPEAIDTQITFEDVQRLIDKAKAEIKKLKAEQKENNKEIKALEESLGKEKKEKKKKNLQEKLDEKKAQAATINSRLKELDNEKKRLEDIRDHNLSRFVKKPSYLCYNKNKEFIQPYLVQYNETFFDFLVRVSNRCGEYLYYENGNFHIGLDIERDKDNNITSPQTAITEYVSISLSDDTDSAWKKNYIADSHHNYSLTVDKMKCFPSEQKDNENIQLRDSILASDENLVSLPKKDEYTKWEDFALVPGCYAINVITDIINSENIADAIVNVATNTVAVRVNSKYLADTANNDYEKENFKDGTYTEERKNGEEIHPFSTSGSITNTVLDKYLTFSMEFYENVRKKIEETERSRIKIELGSHFYPIMLGSLITIDGNTYVVVQMDGCIDSGTETLHIEAIPYEDKDKKVFPPAAHVSTIREAKAQRAFITHNTDPLKMNRVRVRYPWQGKTENKEDLKASEDSTPWIRIALPMASDSSGFNFLPQIGDEAIINYENGNIEKPYVEGMLYSRGKDVPYDFKRANARVISSVNGHSIVFSDPPASTDAFKGLSPAWGTIRSFCPTALKWGLPDEFKKAIGGIEFTDDNGLYSISMSSDKRAISIDSPLGKVDINAFTGITISAPNGKVRIEGKDIEIAAGNNLSISSGNNIASPFWHMKNSEWRKGGVDFLKTLCKESLSKFAIVDMGLVRTILETFLRPCGGTLRIKSNRYLLFEAGKGEAQIAGRQTVKDLSLKKTAKLFILPDQISKVTISYHGEDVVTNRIPLHINNVIQAVHAADAAFRATNVFLLREKNAYTEAYNNIVVIDGYKVFITNGDQLKNFNNFYPADVSTFAGFQMNNAAKPRAARVGSVMDEWRLDKRNFYPIETYLNKLNKHALNIKDKRLTTEKIWNEFRTVYLQDAIVREKINNDATIRGDIDTLFNGSVTNNYLTNGPQNLNKANIRKLVVDILDILIRHQQTEEVKTAAYTRKDKITRAYATEPQNYADDNQWNNFCEKIDYEHDTKAIKILKTGGSALLETFVRLIGVNNFSGMLDNYIWDTSEDSGKILFSDKAGETLNFNNKEIHYYKKSESDPLQSLKDILSGIR